MQPPVLEGDALKRRASRDEPVPFAETEDGTPIRSEPVTPGQQEEMVTVVIDGRFLPGGVPRAVPLLDFLGNPVLGPDGRPRVRPTTIYDAALRILGAEEAAKRIPVLCHQEHVNPVGVCRICSVQVVEKEGEKDPKPRRTLAPACQHRVPERTDTAMWVITRGYKSGECGESYKAQDRAWVGYAKVVNAGVQMLSRLLAVDHYHPDPQRDNRYHNELSPLVAAVPPASTGKPLPRPTGERNKDQLHPRSRRQELQTVRPFSARTIEVDHNNCILCDRCVRGCADVKGFKIIGHTGKGYRTRISFDLDRVMNDSNCVQCGECAAVCPTGALVFRRRVAPTAWTDPDRTTAPDRQLEIPAEFSKPLPVGLPDAEELQQLQFDKIHACPGEVYHPFAEIPRAYLKWNEGSVRERKVKKGDWLCREGEYGSTAFLLDSGKFELWRRKGKSKSRSLFSLFGSKSAFDPGEPEFVRDHTEFILGEMACLTAQQRSHSIKVIEPGIVYEVTRNLLDMMQRTRRGRQVLDRLYKERAVSVCLNNSKLFKELPLSEAQRGGLRQALLEGATIERYQPGQRIITEGEPADAFYVIRLGFAEISRRLEGKDIYLERCGPNDNIGEIALLNFRWSEMPGSEPFRDRYAGSRRTASVTALDHIEVLRVPGQSFLDFLRKPENGAILDALAQGCIRMLKENEERLRLPRQVESEFVRLGLYQGQKLLVLDLERCTRCDECTRGCADSHGDDYSRLLREGLRFDRFLVATCCRSCYQPHCLEGCPVDAIHRKGKALEVVIDNHCIGCGLCERNCPYGAIQMTHAGPTDGPVTAAVTRKAVNCDLCHDLVPDSNPTPFCVRACPHDAAFRFSGEDLLGELKKRSS